MSTRLGIRGTSLLELLVVIALLAIVLGIAAVATPLGRPAGDAEERDAALATARRDALALGRPVSITLTLNGRPIAATAFPDGRVLADTTLAVDALTGRSGRER